MQIPPRRARSAPGTGVQGPTRAPRASQARRVRASRALATWRLLAEGDLQVVGPGNGVVVVRRNLFEAERRVEFARRLHFVERVEQHRRIAGRDRTVDEG